ISQEALSLPTVYTVGNPAPYVDRQPVRIDSPAAAIRRGIGMLHQDPLDFPSLTVLENSGKLYIVRQRGAWVWGCERAENVSEKPVKSLASTSTRMRLSAV
ncbi:hypothetical protein NW835_06775, partial [Synechococcus sp. OH2]